jgi:homoserine O-succinyltransferase/O-acetyltransferase
MTITHPEKTSSQHVRAHLRVGLVNNMPDGALAATERQFNDLLSAAALDHEVELVLFQIPEIERRADVRADMERRYRPADAIAQSGLSALVVTGAAAKDGSLRDEPYWPSFARLVDLAVALKLPTVWSCLAAHAAVEHLDRIARRPLADKCSGFYDCAPMRSDPLLRGIERNWSVPHSRYNDLCADELEAHGYEILTRSPTAGVDVFVRRGPPLFLFCQGHPEYDRHSLTLEYKRDLRAYVEGERATPPLRPAGALDPEMEQTFSQLAQAATRPGSAALAADAPAGPEARPSAPEWRAFAVGLYRNWLRSAI